MHCGKSKLILISIHTLLAMFLVFSLHAQFRGGAGTLSDPYQVETRQHLENVRDYPDDHFVQIANIDISEVSNWVPIGTSANPFTGSYNGDGNEITGMFIHNEVLGPQGLFGVTSNAHITDVGLVDIYINTPASEVGGLVGHAINTIIENCYSVSGDIESERSNFWIIAQDSSVGGLVGLLQGTHKVNDQFISAIKNSYNEVNIYGNDRVGGLVGSTAPWPGTTGYSWIYRSYNAGDVVDNDKVGGLIGMNAYGSLIEESYSTGLVDGNDQVGGLIGVNYGHVLNSFKVCDTPIYGDYVGALVGLNLNNGIIENCYSNGIVVGTGDAEHPGGLVGYGGPGGPPGGNSYGQVINSYWDADISPGQFPWYWPYNPEVTGYARTTEEMSHYPYADNTYVEWDFDEIWESNGPGTNRGYPTLRNVNFEYEYCPGLPVELASFTATILNVDSVSLLWVSQTETNMIGYHIYRGTTNSTNEATRITNSIIPATNTSSTHSYSFVDDNLAIDQTYYYWLQSVDLDLTYQFHGPVTVIIEQEPEIPNPVYVTSLSNPYPNPMNPFNPAATIQFSMRETGRMELAVYNIRGQLVKKFVDGVQPEGEFQITWDGRDSQGRPLSSGIYFLRMQTDNYQHTSKMMIVK